MQMYEDLLKKEERVMFDLRRLYRSYGYMPFKMNKFEEYDLYARNKDFLVSDGVLTFTDTNGRLMALKPDVTLSIIKNSKDCPGEIQKVFYNENVYRVSRSTGGYREIMQTGLECIGDLDFYHIADVVLLAAESLQRIQPEFLLDVSHMGLVMELVSALGLNSSTRDEVMECIGAKNTHGLMHLCRMAGADEAAAEKLVQLVNISGEGDGVLEALKPLCTTEGMQAAWEQLRVLVRLINESGFRHRVRLDFSVIHNRHYYNGLVFQGFVSGAPNSVLSGGQYDKLMKKMGRSARAIGFAVYMDELERLGDEDDHFDFDVLLLYNENTDPADLRRRVRRLIDQGETVCTARSENKAVRCRRTIDLTKEGL